LHLWGDNSFTKSPPSPNPFDANASIFVTMLLPTKDCFHHDLSSSLTVGSVKWHILDLLFSRLCCLKMSHAFHIIYGIVISCTFSVTCLLSILTGLLMIVQSLGWL
jgi:hypothetical protein